jgi:uroporphyrinogen III methyltransferase/synthase
MELLQSADAIVFDALANPDLLKSARGAADPSRKPAELHDVGKRGGDAEGSARQEMINELLVRLVREGKRVVRLKGGDPFVFGRGGEEAQALAEAGLPFEVVPGVTAGIAAPAYAGIPVTHRGLSTSVTFVTGHEDPMKGAPLTDWSALARSGGTIVLYMGVNRLPAIASALIAGGMSGEVPAAAIQWGTQGNQRTVVATLENVAEVAREAGIGAPAITVVGWPVVLRDEIAWFDRRPLFGQRILVTRAGDASPRSSLAARLRAQGAAVVEVAATRIAPIRPESLNATLARLTEFHWIAFTSANAATAFWRRLSESGRDARALSGAKLCVIGPGTAAALATCGLRPDVVARRFAAEGLLEELRLRDDVAGSQFLFPCAEGASDVLARGLGEMGASVERLHLYRSEADPGNAALLRNEVSQGVLTLAAFSSASAVRAFASAAGAEFSGTVRAASIGPVTSAALRDHGIDVAIEAPEATLDSLVAAIVQHISPSAGEWEEHTDGGDSDMSTDRGNGLE